MNSIRVFVLVAACGLLMGCGASEGESACLEFADTMGNDAKRCGLDYQVNHDAAVAAATSGQGCEAVKQVRDLDGFENVCIPFLEKMTCAQLNDPTTAFPAECKSQFAR